MDGGFDERPRARGGPAKGSRGDTDRPHLFETLESDVARVHPLSLDLARDGEWSIGRDAAASIVLAHDPEVSRRHAVLRWRQGRFEIVDLPSSRNGTWVNGERLAKGRPRLLAAGDLIQLGSSQLEFRP